LEAPNVILITVDCLRADHLGCYGYNRDTSPNIDSLASRGAKFQEVISNGGNTASAFPSIMASALPPLETAEEKEIIQRSATLAEALESAGYQTAGFHSNPLLTRFDGYGKGFQMFDDSFRQFSPKGARLWIRRMPKFRDSLMSKALSKASLMLKPISSRVLARPIITAEEITGKAVAWLEAHKDKFFLWLHYMDIHGPYVPAQRYLSLFCDRSVSQRWMKIVYRSMSRTPDKLSPSDIETLVNVYDANIRYTDDSIGLLLDKLGSHLANTFVILTADHGEELGEHGNFGHHSLYDGVLHVPLIINGPGIKGGTLVKQQVSLINLAPTITGLAGINKPRSFLGRSLFPLMKKGTETMEHTISTRVDARSAQRDISYRAAGKKYIRTESLAGEEPVLEEEVYDLRNDPGEMRNLHGTDIDEVRRFELEVKDKLSQFKQLKIEEKTAYEKREIKAQFKRLRRL